MNKDHYIQGHLMSSEVPRQQGRGYESMCWSITISSPAYTLPLALTGHCDYKEAAGLVGLSSGAV